MATIPLDIRVRVERGQDTKRAIRGITKDFEQLGKQATRSANQQNRARLRDEERTQRRILAAHRRTENERRQLERRGHRLRMQEMQLELRQIRRERREIRERSREALRSIRAETRAREQARRAQRRAGAAIGAAGIAAGVSTFNRAETFTRTPTQQESFAREEARQRQLFNLRQEARLTPEQTEAIRQRTLQVASDRGIAPDTLTSGAVLSQQRFSNVEFYLESLDILAQQHIATGAEFEGLTLLAGELQRQFGISAEELPIAMGFIKEAVAEGSVEIDDFNNSFIPVMGEFVQQMRRDGLPALREFVAVAQAGGESQPSADINATQIRNFLGVLNDPDTRERLETVGARVAGADGRLLNVREIAENLARNELLQDPQIFNEVFRERRAARGARGLIQSVNRGDSVLGRIQEIGGEVGAAEIRQGAAEAQLEPAFQLQRERVRSEVRVAQQFDQLAEESLNVTTEIRKLMDENVLLTQGMGVLRDSALTAAAGLLVLGAGGVGGGRGGGIGGTAIPGGGGRVGAAASSFARIAGSAFAVLAAGAIGVQIGRLVDDKLGISNAVAGIDENGNLQEGSVVVPSRGRAGGRAIRATNTRGIPTEGNLMGFTADGKPVLRSDTETKEAVEDQTRRVVSAIEGLGTVLREQQPLTPLIGPDLGSTGP